MRLDDLLNQIISTIDREGPDKVELPTATIRAIAQHTLDLRAGIRGVMHSPYLMYEEVETLENLLKESEPATQPVPKTTEEKVEFRKDWDRRVEEGK